MVWWYYAIAFVVSTLVSIALAPKPARPRPAALDDFDFPVAEEGRSIPVVFGTARVTGANVLWYGDLSSKAIKKSSMFSSTTIGYEYHVGIHFGICHGPVDAVTKVEVGDKTAWTGNVTASAQGVGGINITQRKLFGGKKREGGIAGTLDMCFGEPTQAANGYLDAQIAGPVPAYRGVLGFVWRGNAAMAIFGHSGGYIGNTAYPKPWAFTVRRISKGWLNDTVWYSAKAAVGTSMNAAHVLYQCLTDPEWGMGMPATALDDAEWRARADELHAEGFGLDMIWNQQSSIEDFIGIVLDHIGGIVRLNHSTGKIELVLVRGDYDIGDLDLYDESSVTAITKYQRQGWGETVNEVHLTFTDAVTRKTTSTTVQDLANIRSQGVVVSERIDLPGLTNQTLALKCAQRELQIRSTPLAQVTLQVNRRFWGHVVGDVIRLSWAPLGIADMALRVLQVKRGTLTDGLIEVSCVEDVFGLPQSTYTDVPAPGDDATVPDPPESDDSGGTGVISTVTTAPPASPNDGDRYYVPAGATGAWAGHEGQIAIWDADEEAWQFETPAEGTIIYDETEDEHVVVGPGGTLTPAPWSQAGYPAQLAYSGI